MRLSLYLRTHIYEEIRRGCSLVIRISSQKLDGIWFSGATNDRHQLVACAFSDRSRRDAEQAVIQALPPGTIRLSNKRSGSERLLRQLHRLFMGESWADRDSLDLSRVSEFSRKVYFMLHSIPRGRVTTYGAIAKKLGSGRYARAVGTAVARNPLPLVIPCHRVVPSSLRIGNYGMGGRKPSAGGYIKKQILEREGVRFQGDKVSKDSLWLPG